MEDLILLRQRLRLLAKPDPYAVGGCYHIRSLYFDTPSDKALREKLDGVNGREKFRIRCYNRDFSLIHLEKKSKRNGLGRKEKVRLTPDQVQALMNGETNWMMASGNPLLQELCCKMKLQGLRPRTLVDYIREPFVYGPGNVRVTLDHQLRTLFFMTTFSDIFKSSFMENLSSVSIPDALIALALAFALGLFIFLIYKKTYAGVMYSSGFGVTLLALTMITTLVILAVTSNVVLSLGMVGALSIVRFRTAIKEPLDIAFLFWSIAVGIVLAAGMIPLAVLGSGVIGVILLAFANRKPHVRPYIAVLQCDGQASEHRAVEYLKTQVQRCVVKSKTAQQGSVELNLEVRLKGDGTDFINDIAALEGVRSAVLVSYNGDYMG